jgi:hypothetical protein
MNPYRIGRRLVGGDYEYSIIEVFYDYDNDDPLFIKKLQELKPNEDLELKPLPIKMVNYSEANILSKWGKLSELKDAYKLIEAAFKKAVIDLDRFPTEIENELVKKSIK